MRKKVYFMFILFLVFPVIFNQLLVSSLFENVDLSTFNNSANSVSINVHDDSSFFPPYLTNSQKDAKKKDQVLIHSTGFSSPKLSYGLYKTETSLSSVPSLINKGENFTVSSSTKFDLGMKYPVDQGTIYWYDLNCILEDKAESSSFVEGTKVAVGFSLSSSTSFMAVSFNISNLGDSSGDNLNVYLTADLANYSTNFLAKSALSFKYYNTQSGHSSFFAFYDNPLTTKNNSTLEAGLTYYVVLEGDSNLRIQSSLDSVEEDNNDIFVFTGSSWDFQSGIDAQMSIYTGLKLEEKSINPVTGETSLYYQSSQSTFKKHTLVAFYYDTSGMYDLSSDSADFEVVDSTIPEYLSLIVPDRAEYTDYVDLQAFVENYYNQPLSGQRVYFYSSEDNSTWSLIGSSLTDSLGSAVKSFLIDKASGYYYFKAVVSSLEAYDSTATDKEQVIIETPLVQTYYGNLSGSSTLESFSLTVRIVDNDNTPIVGEIVFFYVEGKTFVYDFTNEEGYAKTHPYTVNWPTGFYNNKYWINLDLDPNLYSFPSVQYGDIQVLPGNLEIFPVEESQTNLWLNETVFTFEVRDNESDLVGNVQFEALFYDPYFDQNISLGYFQANSSGIGEITIPAAFKEAGDYQIYISIVDPNYNSVEKQLELHLTPSSSSFTCNLQANFDYLYNSSLLIEGLVKDELGDIVSGAQVSIWISYPDLFFNFEYQFVITTNETGYFHLVVTLNLEIGQQLLIKIKVDNTYGSNGEIIYTESLPKDFYPTCIRRTASLTGIDDFTTQNQETITITGELIDSHSQEPLTDKEIGIHINGINYFVYTNEQGFFSFVYLVEFGSNVSFTVFFESDSHYNSLSITKTIYSSPISLNLTINDVLCSPNSVITFTSYGNSSLGTTPANVEVEYYWYNGQWILLGRSVTNDSGIAQLTCTSPNELGMFSWKVVVAKTEDWIASSSAEQVFQIGYLTEISLESPIQAPFKSTIEVNFTTTDQYNNPINVQIYFYINGVLIDQVFTENGFASYSWTIDLVAGYYEFLALIPDQSNYISSSDTKEFTIVRADTYISGTDLVMTCNETQTMTFFVYSASGAISNLPVNLSLSNGYSSIFTSNSSGYIVWDVPFLPAGTYIVNLTFSGDNRYEPVSVSYSLVINKIETQVSLIAEDSYYTDNYHISGFVEDSKGRALEGIIINLYINSSFTLSTATLSDGSYSFNVLLLPNYYIIEVKVDDTDYLSSSLQNKGVRIYKLNSSINGQISFENDTMIINSSLTSDSNFIQEQLIYFYVNGSLAGTNITDLNGQASFSILNVTPNLYSIIIEFQGNEIYKPSSITIQAEKNKEQTEIQVEIEEGKYSENPTSIFVSLTSNGEKLISQLITLNIANSSYIALTNSTGVAVFVLDIDFKPGTYIAEIVYEGSEIYSPNTFYAQLSVYKASCYFSSLEVIYNDNFAYLNGKIESNYILDDETLVVEINESFYSVAQTDENGSFSILLNLNPGNYVLTVTFEGNDYYLPTNQAKEFTISKIASEFDFLIIYSTVEFGKSSLVEFKLFSSINASGIEGEVFVYLNDSFVSVVDTDAEGSGSVFIPNSLVVGFYTLELVYNGNSFYFSSSASSSFRVKYNLEITISCDLQSYGTEGVISGSLNYPISGLSIVLSIESLSFTTETMIENSEFKFALPSNLNAGNFTIELYIAETETNFELVRFFETTRGYEDFDVTFINTKFKFNSEAHINGTIHFTGLYSSLGKVFITVDDILLLELSFSQETFSIPHSVFSFIPGKYNVSFYFEFENENFRNKEIVKEIEILKDDLTLNVKYSTESLLVFDTFSFNVSSSIPLSIDDLSLFINNSAVLKENIQLSEYDNLLIIELKIKVAGEVNITLAFKENEYYYNSSTSFFIQVNKRDVSLDYNENTFYFNSSKPLIVSLNAWENETELNFQILIGNKLFNGTNSLVISLFNFPVGEKEVMIFFEGNECYNSLYTSFNISILPQPTKLKVEEDEQEYLITILLLDSENRTISNAEITVFFLDSTKKVLENRSLITDSNGYIKLDVSTFPEGTSIIRINFEGQLVYEETNLDVKVEDLVTTYMKNVTLPKKNLIHMLIAIPLSIVGLIVYTRKDFFKSLIKH